MQGALKKLPKNDKNDLKQAKTTQNCFDNTFSNILDSKIRYSGSREAGGWLETYLLD